MVDKVEIKMIFSSLFDLVQVILHYHRLIFLFRKLGIFIVHMHTLLRCINLRITKILNWLDNIGKWRALI